MKPTKQATSNYTPARGELLKVFPTTMFRGYCPLDRNQVINDVRALVDEVREKAEDNIMTNYTTYFNHELRKKQEQWSWYNSFANCMKDSYIEFIRTQWGYPVDHLSRHDIHFFSWVNRYEKQHWHDTHNHVNSLISGTYYVKADGLEPIKFFSPSATSEFGTGYTIDDVTIEEYRDIEFSGSAGVQTEMRVFPRDGEFLLWPSYLYHSVPQCPEQNNDDYERISISFNLAHRDELSDRRSGDQLHYDFLK